MGLNKDNIETKAMKVGTNFEHRILAKIPKVTEKDTQILIPEIGLRVNYDGTGKDYICEVKTSKNEYKLTKSHFLQAQVEMLAWRMKYGVIPEMEIAAYQVNEQDYLNYFTPIDLERLKLIPVQFDQSIADEYLKRLEIIHDCIKRGAKP